MPATVAWKPELSIATHSATPSNAYTKVPRTPSQLTSAVTTSSAPPSTSAGTVRWSV